MTSADPALLDEAVALARQAGALTLRWFRSPDLAVDQKGDGTPVTEADRAAERLLREAIGRHHPDDTVVGEEEADQVGSSGRRWIVDPIDGTKAFTRGVPLYSNLVAVDDDEGPLLGVINLPALGETVYAGRGLGCFANGERVSVSGTDGLGRSLVSTSGYSNWDDGALLRLKHTGAMLRTWGDGYGYALVACGRIDAMVDPEVSLWDVAPMPVILAEAGGRFSAWDGSGDPAAGSGVATNGRVHDDLLAVLRGE
jgi:histidinol-phosphatase